MTVILTPEIFRILCACVGSGAITKIFCSPLEVWLPQWIFLFDKKIIFLIFAWPLCALWAHIVQMIIVLSQGITLDFVIAC